MLSHMVVSVMVGSFLLAVAGCATTRTEQFDVEVHNHTSQPLTLSLAKTGGPYEVAWATPEDLAMESPHMREDWQKTASGMSGEPIPPGRTAFVQHLTGHFIGGSHGVLRIYLGHPTISQMLSMSEGSPDRVDVPLVPGPNNIAVDTENGHLTAIVDQPPHH